MRYALRSLHRRPGFAAVVISAIALGAGATTVMFTVVNSVLPKPLAYAEPERLVRLQGTVGAIAAGRLLQRFVEGVWPTEPSTLALMIGLNPEPREPCEPRTP